VLSSFNKGRGFETSHIADTQRPLSTSQGRAVVGLQRLAGERQLEASLFWVKCTF
jgi:hypothetical protein